ncbi:HNH endonuclease [Ralstonia phage RpY1]|nr:HNH endonuclease [Ralstonia phage RpY1]
MMESFVGPAPEGFEVCHNDGVRTNCNLSNLRYGTRRENAADTKLHGARNPARGEASGSAKLTEEAVRAIRANPRKLSARKLALEHSVSHTTISAVINHKSWGHVSG